MLSKYVTVLLPGIVVAAGEVPGNVCGFDVRCKVDISVERCSTSTKPSYSSSMTSYFIRVQLKLLKVSKSET